MAGPITIKRLGKGRYTVAKHGTHVADILRSVSGDDGHDPHASWLLKTTTGRIDRFGTKGEAVDDAIKI